MFVEKNQQNFEKIFPLDVLCKEESCENKTERSILVNGPTFNKDHSGQSFLFSKTEKNIKAATTRCCFYV